MKFGFENIKDALDVLIVPISVGLLALIWPSLAARKRRKNFVYLIAQELEEATPETKNLPPDTPWHGHLTRRFLHEEIICHPVENTEFVLSLDPSFAYCVSQMWIAFNKGLKKGREPSQDEAQQWCWYLKETCNFLDKQRFSSHHLTKKVYEPWRKIVKEKYSNAEVE
jgi:hypothetical protein